MSDRLRVGLIAIITTLICGVMIYAAFSPRSIIEHMTGFR